MAENADDGDFELLNWAEKGADGGRENSGKITAFAAKWVCAIKNLGIKKYSKTGCFYSTSIVCNRK